MPLTHPNDFEMSGGTQGYRNLQFELSGVEGDMSTAWVTCSGKDTLSDGATRIAPHHEVWFWPKGVLAGKPAPIEGALTLVVTVLEDSKEASGWVSPVAPGVEVEARAYPGKYLEVLEGAYQKRDGTDYDYAFFGPVDPDEASVPALLTFALDRNTGDERHEIHWWTEQLQTFFAGKAGASWTLQRVSPSPQQPVTTQGLKIVDHVIDETG